jgi:hypothetical protein
LLKTFYFSSTQLSLHLVRVSQIIRGATIFLKSLNVLFIYSGRQLAAGSACFRGLARHFKTARESKPRVSNMTKVIKLGNVWILVL